MSLKSFSSGLLTVFLFFSDGCRTVPAKQNVIYHGKTWAISGNYNISFEPVHEEEIEQKVRAYINGRIMQEMYLFPYVWRVCAQSRNPRILSVCGDGP